MLVISRVHRPMFESTNLGKGCLSAPLVPPWCRSGAFRKRRLDVLIDLSHNNALQVVGRSIDCDVVASLPVLEAKLEGAIDSG